MNLRHVRLIVRREYLQRVKGPGFIIGTILGVLGLAALSFLPVLLNLLNQQSATKIAVVDQRNLIYPYLSALTAPTPTPVPGSSTAQSSLPLSSSLKFSKADTTDESVLSQRVIKGDINAYVIVNGDKPSAVTFTYHGKDRPAVLAATQLTAYLTAATTQAKLQELGITSQQAGVIFSSPTLNVEPVVGGALKDEKVQFQSSALVYILLVLLYITILMYGVQVAMGVVEEKSSRVMEILITAVQPIELMMGKVLGVGLAGLTQYGLWVLSGLSVLLLGGSLGQTLSGSGIDIASVPAATLFSFLLFFVLGYLLLASLYAALGSLVSRTEEVNSITGPLTIVMVGVYLVSIYAISNPDAEFVRWLSFVPFFTPMLMFIRVALSNPALWEFILAVVILAATSLLFTWIAAKIYRVGVLLYGKRPSFREIARLLRAS